MRPVSWPQPGGRRDERQPREVAPGERGQGYRFDSSLHELEPVNRATVLRRACLSPMDFRQHQRVASPCAGMQPGQRTTLT